MSVSFDKLGSYGHMGNALFQSACTIALAKRHGTSYLFPSSWKYKNTFNFPQDSFVTNIKPSYTYEEPNFHYTTVPYRAGINIRGYFQSEKYFEDCKEYIRTIFTPKQKISLQKGVVGIHVRRGDYVTLPNHHPALAMNYYEKAMEMVDAEKFLICSDDIPWCKSHFIGNQFEFSDGQNEVTDFCLQMSCEHNIIANSSYSWWAAWLNDNIDQKVIAPKTWFGTLLDHSTKDLYVSDWMVI